MDAILNFCAFSMVLKASSKVYIYQNMCRKWADHSCPVTSLQLMESFAAPGVRCRIAFMYSAFQTDISCFIHLDHVCEALYSQAGLYYLYFDKMLALNHVLQSKDPPYHWKTLNFGKQSLFSLQYPFILIEGIIFIFRWVTWFFVFHDVFQGLPQSTYFLVRNDAVYPSAFIVFAAFLYNKKINKVEFSVYILRPLDVVGMSPKQFPQRWIIHQILFKRSSYSN